MTNEELIQSELPKLKVSYAYVLPNMPSNKLENAVKYIADSEVVASDVIGVYDSTLFSSAKKGFLFTKDTLYFNIGGYQGRIAYKNIDFVSNGLDVTSDFMPTKAFQLWAKGMPDRPYVKTSDSFSEVLIDLFNSLSDL